MLRTASIAAAVAVSLWVGAARAQTPWGGDDTGFLLPAGPAATCEKQAATADRKLELCLRKCHAHRFAQPNNTSDATEDKCETVGTNSCTAHFVTAIGKLNGCPPCINGVSMGALAAATEQRIDGTNGLVYCAAGTPWGGDDTGFILPARRATPSWFCEARAAAAQTKLYRCIRDCHAHRFSGQLADEAAEEGCEVVGSKSCLGVFSTAIARLTDCPSCLDGTTIATIAILAESTLDLENGAVYCASPSGAFVK